MPRRYRSIDAARGLAASAVVLYHVASLNPNPLAHGPHGPPPVDLHLGRPAVAIFFVVSGYCLSSAGDEAILRGLLLREFMARRVRRIWPPYLASLLVWVATRALKVAMGGANELHLTASQWAQNLTLTQWTSDARPLTHGAPFFANPVYWSLGYEEQFYLLVGLLVTSFAASRWMRWVGALALVGVAWNLLGVGGYLFVSWWPLFALGALAYATVHRGAGWLPWVATILGTVAIAARRWGEPLDTGIDSASAVAAMSFAVALGACWRYDEAIASSLPGRAACEFGRVSYSLYLVHYPLLSIVYELVGRGTRWALPAPAFWGAQLAVHAAFATAFWWVAERTTASRGREPSHDLGSLRRV